MPPRFGSYEPRYVGLFQKIPKLNPISGPTTETDCLTSSSLSPSVRSYPNWR